MLNEIPKFSKRLLKPNQNLAIAVQTETTKIKKRKVDAMEVFFFKVISSNRMKYRWDGPDLDSGSSKDYDYLGDTGLGSGDEVLRIEHDAWLLNHFVLSPFQEHLRIYPKIFGEEICGLEWTKTQDPDPTAPTDYGYVEGREIKGMENPTAQLEGITWKQNAGRTPFRYGFYNDDTKRVNVLLNIIGRTYSVQPITKESKMKKMVTGEIPRRWITLGSVVKSYSVSIPDEWKAVGNSMVVEKPRFKGGRR